MELATIEMPKAEARKAFLEYRRAVRERHNAEDEMIMRGYRAMSMGRPIIKLSDVIKAGGETQRRWPKLAISRADEKRIHVRRYADGRLEYSPSVGFYYRINERAKRTWAFGEGTLPTVERHEAWHNWVAEAIVPNIPPHLRPKGALSRYYVLFEAEWQQSAPVDPALLRHLGGDLYMVLATWDLTPLEQAVLGLTRN